MAGLMLAKPVPPVQTMLAVAKVSVVPKVCVQPTLLNVIKALVITMALVTLGKIAPVPTVMANKMAARWG